MHSILINSKILIFNTHIGLHMYTQIHVRAYFLGFKNTQTYTSAH